MAFRHLDMAQLTLSLSLDPVHLSENPPDREALRSALVGEVASAIGTLPGTLTLSEAEPLARTLDLYASLGQDFVHIMRYYLGTVALRVKATLGHGSDSMGQCAARWSIDVSILRVYASASKRTKGNVRLFDRFLQSEGTYKTQEHIRQFTSLMKDPELMPEDAAKLLRQRQTENAVRTIEHNVESEGYEDPDTRRSVTVMVAETAGIELDYEAVEEPVIVSRETYGSGFTQAEAYAKLCEDMRAWLEEATAEWCVWNGVKTAPRSARALRRIVDWSEDLICNRLYALPDSMEEIDVYNQEEEEVPV